MQTKRILVIEESELVRETLAIILGREFVVAKRPFGKGAFSFAETDRDVDLLILGVTPAIGKEPFSLLRFADKAPFAVLFLVDSKSAARAIDNRERVCCLAKPFSPYELKEKVGQLLTSRSILSEALSHADVEPQEEAKMGSKIEIGRKQECVAISYLREVGRIPSIPHYFDKSSSGPSETVLPLRVLLAKQMVECNRGNMILDYSDTEKDFLKMEFLIA